MNINDVFKILGDSERESLKLRGRVHRIDQTGDRSMELK